MLVSWAADFRSDLEVEVTDLAASTAFEDVDVMMRDQYGSWTGDERSWQREYGAQGVFG